MNEQENKLKSLLIKQQFGEKDGLQLFLETAQKHAYSYAQATNGIAVLSDLQDDVC